MTQRIEQSLLNEFENELKKELIKPQPDKIASTQSESLDEFWKKFLSEDFPKGKINEMLEKNFAIYICQNNLDIENIKDFYLKNNWSLDGLLGWVKKVRKGELRTFNIKELLIWANEFSQNLVPLLEQIKTELEQSENLSKRYKNIPIQDFLTKSVEKENPIIKPFIPEKSIITIFGDTGTLKSILANYMGSCVATGTKFLNKYRVKKKSVLILSTENSTRTDKKRLRAIFRGLNINPIRRSVDNLKLSICPRNQVGLFSDLLYYHRLRNIIKDNGVKLLIIDTISPMISDTNDNLAGEVVTTFNDKLFPLIDEFGLSIILIMHSQKTGKDFLGSIKHKASADAFFELIRDEENNLSLLCHKHRDGETNLKMIVKLEEKEDTLYKVSFNFLEEWRGKQSPSNKENNPAKLERAKGFITELLTNKELSYNEILDSCVSMSFSKATSKRAINLLYEATKIKKKKGKKGGYYLV